MDTSSSCSCRLGVIVRALGLGSRPLSKKRRWQFVGSVILFFFAFFFYVAITRNVDHHSIPLLGVFFFLELRRSWPRCLVQSSVSLAATIVFPECETVSFDEAQLRVIRLALTVY